MNNLKITFTYLTLALTLVSCSESESGSQTNQNIEISEDGSEINNAIVGEWMAEVNNKPYRLFAKIEGKYVIIDAKRDGYIGQKVAGVYNPDFTKLTGEGDLLYIESSDRLFFNGSEFRRVH
jgi:hypothetical protein